MIEDLAARSRSHGLSIAVKKGAEMLCGRLRAEPTA